MIATSLRVENAEATRTLAGKDVLRLVYNSGAIHRIVFSPESAACFGMFVEQLELHGVSRDWIQETDPTFKQLAARLVGAEPARLAPVAPSAVPRVVADVFDTAQAYIDAGLAVVWVEGLWQPVPGAPLWVCACRNGERCRAAGKHPVRHRWQMGQLSAAQVDREKRLQARWPKNLGLNHTRSLTWALDADTPEAVAWVERQSWADGLTVIMKTGRGRQWIFRQDADAVMIPTVCQAAFRLVHNIDGLEVRGLGSQSVLPPSMHYFGQPREWLSTGSLELPPPELLDMVWKAAGGQPSLSRVHQRLEQLAGTGKRGPFTTPQRGDWLGTLQAELDQLSGMVEGEGRNNKAWRVACWLLAAVHAEVLPLEYAREVYDQACDACDLTDGSEHLGPWASALSFMSSAVAA